MTFYRIGCAIVAVVLLGGCNRKTPAGTLPLAPVSQVEFIPKLWSGTERVVLSTNQGIVIHKLVKELNSDKATKIQATATFVTFGHFVVDGEKYIWNGRHLIKSDSHFTHRTIASNELKAVEERLTIVLVQNHSSELRPSDWKSIFRVIAR
ncbi:MAG: hypothetical protein ACO1QS_00855 [Verrucomicrobiota bacterium]